MTNTPGWRGSDGHRPRARRIFVPAVLVGVTAAMTVYERRLLAALDGDTDPDVDGEPTLCADAVHDIVTPDGATVHIEECGAGRAVVLLHGHGANLRIFAELATRLAGGGLRVVAIDQRGFGGSSATPPTFGFGGLIDDLATVLATLDLRQAIVVGHSMGGAVALGLAVQRRDVVADRVAALVLVNSSARGPADRPLQRMRATALDLPLAERIGRHPRHGLLLSRANFGAEVRRSQLAAVRTIGLASPVARRQGLTRRLLGIDLRGQLAGVDIPVVVLAGGADRVVPASESEQLVQLLPDGRLTVFEGAGHMLPMEHTAEVADAIVALAAGLGDATPPAGC